MGEKRTLKQHREKIREFIFTNFYVAPDLTLGDETSLLESGIIDSTGVLEVISFLEEQFGLEVEDREMVPENLDSIDSISAYVARKLG